MIDFSRIRKFIYFPQAYDREKDPYVIHVLEAWGKDWKGNTDVEELLAGRCGFFPMQRCQPYTESLWEMCVEWKLRRLELKKDFEAMMRKGER